MGKVSGSDVVLFINVAAVDVPLACARSITFDIANELIETSITGNGSYRTYIPGALEWSGSIEGLVFIYKDVIDKVGLGQIYDFITTKQAITLTWYEQDIEGVTFLQKTGTGYIESVNETSSFDNMVTFTCNFRGTGSITITYGDV
jgi:predicted secreted protein